MLPRVNIAATEMTTIGQYPAPAWIGVEVIVWPEGPATGPTNGAETATGPGPGPTKPSNGAAAPS
ncbi:MAG: hypothetical protein ACLQIB_37670, partial [Isosphaeraceae bacterium]